MPSFGQNPAEAGPMQRGLTQRTGVVRSGSCACGGSQHANARLNSLHIHVLLTARRQLASRLRTPQRSDGGVSSAFGGKRAAVPSQRPGLGHLAADSMPDAQLRASYMAPGSTGRGSASMQRTPLGAHPASTPQLAGKRTPHVQGHGQPPRHTSSAAGQPAVAGAAKRNAAAAFFDAGGNSKAAAGSGAGGGVTDDLLRL